MKNICPYLVPAAKNIRVYSDKLLVGIPEDKFARKPEGVEINHPAFLFGHLSLYPEIVSDLLGLDSSALRSPAGFFDLFKNGAPCLDDPDGQIYPKVSLIVEHFRKGYDSLIETLPSISEDQLNRKIEGERGTRFPVVGSFLLHLLSGHAGIHLGQLSAWRRCVGLGAA